MTESPTYHLLVADDEPGVRAGLQDLFELQGYRTSAAEDGAQALRRLREASDVDLMLLDVMMPRVDGFEVLRQAHEESICPPVIMLTVLDAPHHVRRGFELGLDDYVTKPFNADVLAARVRAVLRRRKPPSQRPMDIYRFGDVEINFSAHEATSGGEPLHLSVLELDLLHYLIQHEGQTVTREELLRRVWQVPGSLETRTIDRHVASVRQKIEPDRSAPVHIKTVYGRGYRFER